ncbi:hypothetical protein BH09MYX1_BH09MYX1_49380 [soil metagenome]
MRSSASSGADDVALYVLLDSSYSMSYGSKWPDTTAALGYFVTAPDAAGVGLALQFFPVRGNECAPESYAIPAVPMGILPSNGAAVKDALANHPVEGTTPALPALKAAFSYMRALKQNDPSREPLLVFVSDGSPSGCDSTTRAVTDLVREAATNAPTVRTFVIGLDNGFPAEMATVAAAGGSGTPVIIDGAVTGPKVVAALRAIRDTVRLCRFSIPPVGDAALTPSDLLVTLHTNGAAATLPLVANEAGCGTGGGFYVDDSRHPTKVQLCASSCSAAHADLASSIDVVAGCGTGARDGAAPEGGTGGDCPTQPDVTCVTSCGAGKTYVVPACVFGTWECGAGTVDQQTCNCPSQPHECCQNDESLVTASCLGGKWICPPGGKLFGEAGCSGPDVCSPTLPCGGDALCVAKDAACGTGPSWGRCEPKPQACAPASSACGCDGKIYPSACAAAASGVDVSATVGCAAPAGTFACGPLFCSSGNEICEKVTDFGKVIAPTTWACVAPPSGCVTGCGCNLCPACPQGKKCGEGCTTQSGGRVLTCSRL